jgi:soluble lytic murein transglycosylase
VHRRRLALTITLLVASLTAAWLWQQARLERRFSEPIRAAASRYGVDPLLIRAVIWRESRFRPDARGRHGEIGLMQLQATAAQEWADAEHQSGFQHPDCFDAATNALAGTYYLGKLLKRYAQTDDPVPYALADFNAGRGNVLKWNQGAAATNSALFIQQIGFPQTRAYVKSVMRHRMLYAVLTHLGWPGQP